MRPSTRFGIVNLKDLKNTFLRFSTRGSTLRQSVNEMSGSFLGFFCIIINNLDLYNALCIKPDIIIVIPIKRSIVEL